MKLASFVVLTLLAVIYASFTVAEGVAFQSWQKTLTDQKDIQAKVLRFQHLKAATEQLLKRLAVDSQHDPALAALLKKHNIQVLVKPTDSNPAPLLPEPEATEKPAPDPANSTPAHP